MIRIHRRTAVAVGGIVVLIVLVAALLPRGGAARFPVATARRAPFTEALVETGAINASRLMLYSSTIAGGQAKILELVPEGSPVSAGDVLIRFDSSTFEQNLARELALLKQAEAELQRAIDEQRLGALRSASAVETARQQIGYAESTLANELQGRGRVAVIEAEAAAAEAGREARRAKTTYDDMKPLFAEHFVTRAELDRAEQNWRRAEDQLQLANLRRDTLVQYEHPAAADRSRSEVDVAKRELDRQTQTGAAQASQQEAAVSAARSRVAEATAKVALLKDQIARTVVRAAGPGLVVYRDLFFGGDRRKPQVGDEVWPNQPIIALPDASQLTVETRVREIDLHKIATSQRVFVRVDAYPDLRLRASVALVGALAQEDASRAGTKFFPVTVRLIDTDPRLRTGMTAQVEIEVTSLPEATVIPTQAVFERDGRHIAFVMIDGGPISRDLSVAGDNGVDAAIRSGLAPGDVVLLVDPADRDSHRQ